MTKESLSEIRENILKELLADCRQALLNQFAKEDKLAEEAKNYIRGIGRPRKFTYNSLEERKKIYLELAQKRYNKTPRVLPDTLQKERKQEANKKYYAKVKAKKLKDNTSTQLDEIKNENDNSKENLE